MESRPWQTTFFSPERAYLNIIIVFVEKITSLRYLGLKRPDFQAYQFRSHDLPKTSAPYIKILAWSHCPTADMFQTHMFRMKSGVLDLHSETANPRPSSCSTQAASVCLAMCCVSSCLDVLFLFIFFRGCSSWFLPRVFLPPVFPFWGHTLIAERLNKLYLSACRTENTAKPMEIRLLLSTYTQF